MRQAPAMGSDRYSKMKRTVTILTLVLAQLLGLWPAYGAEKPVLAVMEVEDRSGKFNQDQLDGATDILRAALAATHHFLVVDRGRQEEKRQALLARLKRESHDPCYDEQCKIELGRNLAADTLLTCRVTALGKTCAFSCEMVPLDRAVADAGGLDKFDCTEDGFSESLDSVVAQLARQTGGGAETEDKPVLAESVPSDDAPVPVRPMVARSLREQYLLTGAGPDLLEDFIESEMALEGWRRYRKGRISGWNMAWCSFLPGSCLYYVALNGGNTFHFVRGLLYSGIFIIGLTSDSSSGSDAQLSDTTAQRIAFLGNIVDGGISIYARNWALMTEMQEKYPRESVPPPPGVGPAGRGW